ncbi:hypothetical protein GB937_010687 [Aspergillus fischeri]|nr:hypothetical protein GB937_010687 [Aspergillus fischeri]
MAEVLLNYNVKNHEGQGRPRNIEVKAMSFSDPPFRIRNSVLQAGDFRLFPAQRRALSIRDVFLALTNDLPNPSASSITSRNGGYSFMALLAVLLTTIALSLSALICGAHLALTCDRFTPPLPFRLTRRVLDPLFVLLGWGCWLGAVFLAIWPPDRSTSNSSNNTLDTWRGRAVFAIVFAPLGCLLRYYLSLYLNPRVPAFPLGTFTLNIFGTIVLAMCFDLQRVDGVGTAIRSDARSAPYAILTSCQVLQGVMDGFCGCATTHKILIWDSALCISA